MKTGVINGKAKLVDKDFSIAKTNLYTGAPGCKPTVNKKRCIERASRLQQITCKTYLNLPKTLDIFPARLDYTELTQIANI